MDIGYRWSVGSVIIVLHFGGGADRKIGYGDPRASVTVGFLYK